MEFPKGYSQYRTDYRENEAERKLQYWLRDFFKNIVYKTIGSVYYYLFGKTTYYGTDRYQFNESIQISRNGNAPYLNLVKTGGTEAAPTAIGSGSIGYVAGTGYYGSDFYVGATLEFVASEVWGGSRGTRIEFKTTPTGTSSIQTSGYIDASGSWASGTGALSTNASSGFLYVPTCAGIPTGTPETISGRLPVVIDETNNKMYFYSGGAWSALN